MPGPAPIAAPVSSRPAARRPRPSFAARRSPHRRFCRHWLRHRRTRLLSDDFVPRMVSLPVRTPAGNDCVEVTVATDAALARARAGDNQAFRELTGPYLGELQLHCYRSLGSAADAEDVMQETLLAAWQGLEHYQQRASLRAWLYRIATNRCLNALRDSGRRPRPQPSGPPFAPPEPTRRGEPVWLEPYPDALLDQIADVEAGPDARYEAKETIALAFVAAVQHLPPRQRAVLLLRDVLGFRAAEVAGMLDASQSSVNSALQRARATMAAQLPGRDRERAPLPRSPRERDLAARFAAAFTSDDIDSVVALLTDGAW